MSKAMRGLEHRTPTAQALVNIEQAIRAAQMIKEQPSELLPTPLVLLMSELRNAERYLRLAAASSSASSSAS